MAESGYDEAKQKRDELAKEITGEEEKEKTQMAEVKQSLQIVAGNPALAKLYQQHAALGADNLGADLPLLKVHITNKSQNNHLEDGTEPQNGWFFYRPTKSEYEDIICHVVTISRGFRADGLQGKKNVFNQILAGIMLNDGDMKPFLMYFTGSKLQNLWNFGKEASKYTKSKLTPIPLFALTVHLTSQLVDNVEYGGKMAHVNFEILKDESGAPMVIADVATFQFVKEQVERMQETIDNLIQAKSTEEGTPPESPRGVVTGVEVTEEPNATTMPF